MTPAGDNFSRAFELFRTRNLQKAEELCKQILRQSPNHADTLHLLGVIQHQMGQHNEAVLFLKRAIALNPEEASYYTNLGIALQSMQAVDEAIANFQKAVALNPNIAELYNNLGLALNSKGQADEAVACFRKALAIKPDYSEAYNNLGLTFKDKGQLLEAAECFKQSLEIQPDSPQALYNMGVALLLNGQTDDALEFFNKTLAIQGPSAELMYNMGRAMQYSGKLFDSIDYFNRAILMNPKVADHYNDLGMSLHMTGKIEEAIESYGKALALNPKLEKAWFNLGTANGDLGDLQTALEYYEKALKLNSAYADPVAGIASVLERLGRTEEAFDRLVKSIDAGVVNENIAMVFGNLSRHFKQQDKAAALLENKLQNERMPMFKQEAMHFTLGKLYDDLSDYEKAFSHYKQGNDMRSFQFEADRHSFIITELIEIYTPKRFESYPRSTIGSQRPIFIIGMPRSGTSLVEQILATHPEVFGAGELDTVHEIVKSLPIRQNSSTPSYMHCMNILTEDMINEVSRYYLEHLDQFSPDAKWVTDKMPQNFMHLGFLNLMFPEARVIHCIRDPLNTALSCYFQLFSKGHDYSYNLTNLGVYYQEYERLMAHWRQIIDIPIMDVHYEELIADTEGQSRKIFEFCGIPWDERCLRFYETKRVVKTASYDQVRQPIYTRSLDRAQFYRPYLQELVDVLGDAILPIPREPNPEKGKKIKR